MQNTPNEYRNDASIPDFPDMGAEADRRSAMTDEEHGRPRTEEKQVSGDVPDGSVQLRDVELPSGLSERYLICTSVVKRYGTNVTKVVFRTNDDIPTYYEFLISSASKDLFSPNVVYVIYFREDSPKHLLAHIQM